MFFARLKFDREHLNWTVEQWNTVLFPDETKFNSVDPNGIRTVQRPGSSRINPKYCSGIVKHGGGKIMVRDCFSGESLRPLHKIGGIMDKQMYKNILLEKMLPHLRDKVASQTHIQIGERIFGTRRR